MKSKTYNQTHLLIFLFVVFCFTKLALIKQIPLINDEAYTLTISRHFSLSYFDHPPFMMWISYFLHFFEIVELYIFRIPYILFGVLTSFFLYKITTIIYLSRLCLPRSQTYNANTTNWFQRGLLPRVERSTTRLQHALRQGQAFFSAERVTADRRDSLRASQKMDGHGKKNIGQENSNRWLKIWKGKEIDRENMSTKILYWTTCLLRYFVELYVYYATHSTNSFRMLDNKYLWTCVQ